MRRRSGPPPFDTRFVVCRRRKSKRPPMRPSSRFKGPVAFKTPTNRKQPARSEGMLSMTTAQTNEPVERKPLRVWPGVLAVVLQWLAWLILPIVVPEALLYGVLGGI